MRGDFENTGWIDMDMSEGVKVPVREAEEDSDLDVASVESPVPSPPFRRGCIRGPTPPPPPTTTNGAPPSSPHSPTPRLNHHRPHLPHHHPPVPSPDRSSERLGDPTPGSQSPPPPPPPAPVQKPAVPGGVAGGPGPRASPRVTSFSVADILDPTK